MKQTKLNLSVMLASLASIFVLAVAPVYADHGSNSGDSSSDTTTTTTADTSTSSSDDSSTDTSGDVNETEVHNKVEMFRQMGHDKLVLARENHSNLKTERRAKVCENIKNAVDNKLVAFDNHASKYLTRLNTVFTKLQAYQTTNNLPVSNYSDLVAAATTAQTNATVAVDALNSLGTSIDCTNSDPGSMLSSVKEGATGARDALKAYRTSLKNIVVALAQAQSTNTTSDTTTTTEGN